MTTAVQISNQAVKASPKVHDLLDRLHSASEAQESSASQGIWYLQRRAMHYLFGTTWSGGSDLQTVDKYVSLERDKSQLAYLLARANGARNIVEAGTSFGVSTIYLALAVGQNVAAAGGSASSVTGKVIATEKEPTKAARAQENWKEAGDEVEPWIEMRVGDLLETLKQPGMPETIDMLLLDIWTPLALPTLKIIKPRIRQGSVILVDNTSWAAAMYKELLDYLHDPENGFRTTTAPYKGGYEVAVYLPN